MLNPETHKNRRAMGKIRVLRDKVQDLEVVVARIETGLQHVKFFAWGSATLVAGILAFLGHNSYSLVGLVSKLEERLLQERLATNPKLDQLLQAMASLEAKVDPGTDEATSLTKNRKAIMEAEPNPFSWPVETPPLEANIRIVDQGILGIIDPNRSDALLVLASRHGRVAQIGQDEAGRGRVEIDHGLHYSTFYGFLSEILVEQDALVEAGQVIGRGSRDTVVGLSFGLKEPGSSVFVSPIQFKFFPKLK